jgi:hypothetical protein
MPALRTIGGDPLGSGQFAGDLYFLMNGWQIVIGHAVQMSGVLYHDDGVPVFVVLPGGGVTATVSNLVQTAETTVPVVTGAVPGVGEIAAAILAAAQLTPIHSDMRKTNGHTIIGNGTEGDKFRSEHVG